MSAIVRLDIADVALFLVVVIGVASCAIGNVAESCEPDGATCQRACAPHGIETVTLDSCRCRGAR